MTIAYAIEKDLGWEEFADLLGRSGLADRRPVEKPDVIRDMVENAGLVISARDGDGRLIGVARSLTDFAYCCTLSDLAVDRACQRRGIGAELIRRTKEASGGDGIALVLLSAPDGMGYYPKVGLEKFDNCFGIHRTREPDRRF